EVQAASGDPHDAVDIGAGGRAQSLPASWLRARVYVSSCASCRVRRSRPRVIRNQRRLDLPALRLPTGLGAFIDADTARRSYRADQDRSWEAMMIGLDLFGLAAGPLLTPQQRKKLVNKRATVPKGYVALP